MKPLLLIGLCLLAASALQAQENDNMPTQGTNQAPQSCINVPVTATGDVEKDVTVNSTTSSHTDYVFMYYHRHKMRHRDYATGEFADLPDDHASKPVMLSEKEITKVLPETYKVTVSTPESRVTACQDSTLSLTTTINAEREAEYTGNYPGAIGHKNTYVELSKRRYKRAERKLVSLERKEKKAGRAAGVTVQGV